MANILGLDVSAWQDNNTTSAKPDFNTARSAGAQFAIIRVSYASTGNAGMYRDEDAPANYANAGAAGLKRGLYHFQTWTRSIADQATFFAEQIALMPPELPAFLDYEWAQGCPDKATASKAALDFLEMVEDKTGKVPGIYTGPSFWNAHGSTDAAFKRFPLWIANWGVTVPSIPKPWTEADFWQYTSSGNGRLYGMESTYVDLNYCLRPDKYGLAGLTLAQKVDKLWAAHPDLHGA